MKLIAIALNVIADQAEISITTQTVIMLTLLLHVGYCKHFSRHFK